jgi:hypothetical protein
MDIVLINTFLERYGLIVISANIVLTLIVLVFSITNMIKMRKYRCLFQGSNGKELEELLFKIYEEQKSFRDNLNKLNQDYEDIKVQSRSYLQNWSLIRFKAFENTGGDQSFAFALLDAKGNGMVMSSIFGREESRMYCKPVEQGISTYILSEEEKEAIRKAYSG